MRFCYHLSFPSSVFDVAVAATGRLAVKVIGDPQQIQMAQDWEEAAIMYCAWTPERLMAQREEDLYNWKITPGMLRKAL